MNQSWIQLRNYRNARVMLILPCNAAACVGNYFRADIYNKKGWNTWREADANLQDLRRKGIVAFGAVDSSILETKQNDPRGAIVLETEMQRASNPDGEDWGAPSWRWFRPTVEGNWKTLEKLTEALVKGVLRVDKMRMSKVIALVNPRAYFLALAAAVNKCDLLDRWILFRPPPHPRFLIQAVNEIIPFVRAATMGVNLNGGIYQIPSIYNNLLEHERNYFDQLPSPWRECNMLPSMHDVYSQWKSLSEQIRQL